MGSPAAPLKAKSTVCEKYDVITSDVGKSGWCMEFSKDSATVPTSSRMETVVRPKVGIGRATCHRGWRNCRLCRAARKSRKSRRVASASSVPGAAIGIYPLNASPSFRADIERDDPTGLYQIVAESVPVEDGLAADSKQLGTLSCGAYVHVAEAQLIDDDGRFFRGRIKSGGWITLADVYTHQTCARKIQTGTYVIAAPSVAVSDSIEEVPQKRWGVARHEILSREKYVDVVEVLLVPADRRIRGRLLSGGWITVIDSKNRDIARAVPLGAYQTLAQTIETTGIDRRSEVRDKIDAGDYVQVVKTE